MLDKPDNYTTICCDKAIDDTKREVVKLVWCGEDIVLGEDIGHYQRFIYCSDHLKLAFPNG